MRTRIVSTSKSKNKARKSLRGSGRFPDAALALIMALSPGAGLAQNIADPSAPAAFYESVGGGEIVGSKSAPAAPEGAQLRQGPGVEGKTGAARHRQGEPPCIYREGFHVPPQLRKPGESFQWGALAVATPVRLRVRDKVATSHAQVGDRIELEVAEDVVVRGYTVIRKGAEAWGIVTQAKRPGLGVAWFVYDDSPNLPEPIFGHKGEFPLLLFRGGRLGFEIEGAYDITGGYVPLLAADVVSGEDYSPNNVIGFYVVMGWEALRQPIEKMSGKQMRALTGRHATLKEGTEIVTEVTTPVCYDVDFLARVREMEQARIHEEEEAMRRGVSHAGADTASSPAQAAPGTDSATAPGASASEGRKGGAMLSELLFASPTSPSNLEAAARYATTLSRLRKAGEQGDAEAQYELGVMYREGQGVAKNEVEAAYWLRKAAGRGIAKAEDSLAAIETHGPGTAPR